MNAGGGKITTAPNIIVRPPDQHRPTASFFPTRHSPSPPSPSSTPRRTTLQHSHPDSSPSLPLVPDIPKLRDRLDWLEAIRSDDPILIHIAQLKILKRHATVATGKTPSIALDITAIGNRSRTPDSTFFLAPSVTPLGSNQTCEKIQKKKGRGDRGSHHHLPSPAHSLLPDLRLPASGKPPRAPPLRPRQGHLCGHNGDH